MLGLYTLFFKRRSFKFFFTPTIIVYLIFIIFFGYLAYQLHVARWDEFSQWAAASKMLYTNHGFFPNNSQDQFFFNGFSHKSYPPGSALFHYFFFTFSDFNEGILYLSQLVLLITPLTLITCKVQWRQWPLAFIFYFISLAIIVFFGAKIGFIGNTMMDSAISIFTAISIICILYSRSDTNVILLLIPAFCTISLFKPLTIPYVLLVNLFYLATFLGTRNKTSTMVTGCLIKSALSILTALCIVYSWKHYLKTHHIKLEYSSHTITSKLFNNSLNIIEKKQHSLYQLLNHGFLHAKITYPPFFSLIPLTMIFIVFVFLLLYFSQNRQEKKQILTTQFLCIIGLLGFLISFSIVNIFIHDFDYGKIGYSGSIGRYLATYFCIWALVLFYQGIPILENFLKSLKIQYASIAAIALIICTISFLKYHIDHNQSHQLQSVSYLRQGINTIVNSTESLVPQNKSIYLVWQNDEGFIRDIFQYSFFPRIISSRPDTFGAPYTISDIYTQNSSNHKFLQNVSQYNYLLLAYTDKNFWSHYKSILQNTKPFTFYTRCIGKGLFDISDPTFHSKKITCDNKTINAYLYKVVHRKGKIYLVNIT